MRVRAADLHPSVLAAAARRGNVRGMEALRRYGPAPDSPTGFSFPCPWDASAAAEAASHDQRDAFEWLWLALAPRDLGETMLRGINAGDNSTLGWALSLLESECPVAIDWSRIDTLSSLDLAMRLQDRGVLDLDDPRNVQVIAARAPNNEGLATLVNLSGRRHRRWWLPIPKAFMWAAREGNLGTLEFMWNSAREACEATLPRAESSHLLKVCMEMAVKGAAKGRGGVLEWILVAMREAAAQRRVRPQAR